MWKHTDVHVFANINKYWGGMAGQQAKPTFQMSVFPATLLSVQHPANVAGRWPMKAQVHGWNSWLTVHPSDEINKTVLKESDVVLRAWKGLFHIQVDVIGAIKVTGLKITGYFGIFLMDHTAFKRKLGPAR